MKVPASFALPILLCSLVSTRASGQAFYGDPPDERHPWAVHDHNRPQPVRVEPGTFGTQEQPGRPPSDARVLFDGTPEALGNWEADKTPAEPTRWEVKEGALQCVPGAGYIRSKEEFGDCQLHVEWSAPSQVQGSSQGRGNSGVFLMGQVEVQVLDNYDNPTYADGFAGSVYGVSPPLANPLVAPGQWQTYDIVFRRPLYRDSKEIDPGSLTVFINGVLVQDHTPLEGGGGHKSRSQPRPFPERGPLKLQDHGNPVRYRNIWYRPLPPRAEEGGGEGALSAAAALAKRQEIAAGLVSSAESLEGDARLLRLLEALCYDGNATVLKEVASLAATYGADLKAVPEDKLEAKKGEVLALQNALAYLGRHQLLPADFVLKTQVDALVAERGWDKKK